MKKEFLELIQRANAENWDSFKIMAEFISIQKEIDAKIAEDNGYPELAEKIRTQ